jgi:hypothetical protein
MELKALTSSRWTTLLILAFGGTVLVTAALYAPPLGRWVILATALVGAGVWSSHFRQVNPEVTRAKVISRLALSSRSQACLIEVDARSFLVVHGERYAQIVDLKPASPFHSLVTGAEQ